MNKKEGSKKRKRNIVEELNGTIEEVRLKIKIVDSLPCCICQLPVYNYREIHNNELTCSYECESILFLSKQNRMLHEKDHVKTFESAMTIPQIKNNLDEVEDNVSIDSKNLSAKSK